MTENMTKYQWPNIRKKQHFTKYDISHFMWTYICYIFCRHNYNIIIILSNILGYIS